VSAAVSAPVPDWLRLVGRDLAALSPDEVLRRPPGMAATAGTTVRRAAVLVVLSGEAADPRVLLLERAADMRTHAGQVAFPGGAVDPGDADPIATAVREAEEEVGLDPSGVTTVAVLPDLFIPPSQFLVTPVLSWWPQPHDVAPVDAREVARVALVSFAALADPENRFTYLHPTGFEAQAFLVDGLFIWGFTGAVLTAMLRVGGWERPWDATRRISYPSPNPTSASTSSPISTA
jgi:8-oxo-dGTP pyrophosphatase MutT (NUDIX family)